ncbi:MAG: histidine phosphatase family protein [Pseudolysinimonas sp.]|uniref:histidine phosphatase family protein n=1 Tax=Pseudolysinimonas sp. TaxID=2680009 RepID=UPI003267B455
MIVAFIRHGQTDWNAQGLLQGSSDIPLNDVGRAQAEELIGMLASAGSWSAVVSSPLARARESARIIADGLGIELGPSYEDLVERDYGPLEGTPADDAIAAHPSRDYPGAEPLSSVKTRGVRALEQIADDFPRGDLIIVSHGTLIRYTLEKIAGRAFESIANGAISVARSEGDGDWDVLTVNGHPVDS